MSKIIIENNSKLPDSAALSCVQWVINEERISNHGKQYCYLTTFYEGEIAVTSHPNKKSDRFIVSDYKEKE